jgi:DinB family protein
MGDLPRETVLDSLLDLLAEAFEGPRDTRFTWFVNNEPDCGVFGTLAAFTAEQASRAPGPGRPSAAAHAGHLLFSLDVGIRWLRGERVKVDWRESWARAVVDEAEWEALQADLRRKYDALRGTILQRDDWEARSLTGVGAAVAHSAYHLGALRQVAQEVGAIACAPPVAAAPAETGANPT